MARIQDTVVLDFVGQNSQHHEHLEEPDAISGDYRVMELEEFQHVRC
jgi:uncharacterized protein YqfA (UPF0365 family)